MIQPYDNGRPRASLDSRTFQPPPPRSSNSFTRPSQVPIQTQEEPHQDFEDVDIQDKPVPQPKKRGLFSRITDYGDHSERPGSQESKKEPWHHFGGRKRGQSGQGSELGAIPKRETTPKPESQLRREPQHAKSRSVDSHVAKTAKDASKSEAAKAAKTVESQAQAGAKADDEVRVDSGADVEGAKDGMKEISLDEPTQSMKKDAAPQAQKEDESPKAPRPQNAQAPEVKGDS